MKVKQIPSTKETLVVEAGFPTCPPELLFDYWVKPDLIRQWWSPEAEIDPRLDGNYHLIWPQRNWHLRGHYTVFEPGEKLAFTWQWDHYSVQEKVIVSFEPLEPQGTKMTIVHGPYDDSKQGQEDRKSHLDGWMHFVSNLQNLMKN